MIEREDIGNVVLLRLCHGKANVLDLELLREISKTFEDLTKSGVGAVVITGSGNIFSAGVDLKRLETGGEKYIREFVPALSDAFEKMFFFPRPLLAACNGHAIAGGAVMLFAADVRYAARGKGLIGVPELLVGVPFPLIAVEIIKFAIRADLFQEVIYGSRNYNMESSLEVGLCEKLFDTEELVEKTCMRAQELADIPGESFRFSKQAMRLGVKDLLMRHGPAMDAEVTDLWCTQAVREAIRTYLSQTLATK